MRVYAIGDIHGCSELLDLMVEAIREDLAAHLARDALTVTLGDYIDRGPDSRGVLDRLARNPFPTDYVALKGNHEQMLETFLRDPSTAPHWLMNGAGETLHSYDVAIERSMTEPISADWQQPFARSFRPRMSNSCPNLSSRSTLAPVFSAMPGFAPACRSIGSAKKICCGFARTFSTARWILARLWCMATRRSTSRKIWPTGSTSKPEHSLPGD
jgi:calcineurin-like phosphoesterase family protein